MGRLDLKSNGLHRAHRIILCLGCGSPGRNNQTGDEANGLMFIPVAWEHHRTPLLDRVEATETASSEGPFTACAVQRRRFPVDASPTRRFAPAGSDRSSHGGNEMA